MATTRPLAVTVAPWRAVKFTVRDTQTPRVDGVEAARTICSNPNLGYAPILAMTANAFAEDWAVVLAAGMDDHLSKPVMPATLYAMVNFWPDRGNSLKASPVSPEARAEATTPRRSDAGPQSPGRADSLLHPEDTPDRDECRPLSPRRAVVNLNSMLFPASCSVNMGLCRRRHDSRTLMRGYLSGYQYGLKGSKHCFSAATASRLLLRRCRAGRFAVVDLFGSACDAFFAKGIEVTRDGLIADGP